MPATTTDYKKKGTVQLKKQIFNVLLITEKQSIVLNNADVSSLYFIEDIFKLCMVGSITFNDRYNIMQYGPFTGNEKIAIIYSVEGDPQASKNREMVFDVWKVGKIQQIGTGLREEAENLITMEFIDPFYTWYNFKRYSRSWSNEYYSDIMRDILQNMVNFKVSDLPFNIEESSNKTDFIIPYWKPQTAIKWLLRRSKGKETGTSGYLCFNNTQQGFSHNLVTMNYLLSDVGRTLDEVKYHFNNAEVSAKNKILEWWISGIDKASNAVIRGGSWKGFDFHKKKLLDNQYVYSDGADNTMMLGRKTLYHQLDDTTSSNMIVGDGTNDTLDVIAYNDWCKRYNMQFILNIIVEGSEKRFAGQQIIIEWPDIVRNTGNQMPFNDLLKGKYLIKSVTHSFDPGGTFPYRQRLVLIKNAYTDIDSQILYKAKKMNLYQEGNSQQINILRS